jgi:pimeloyl-ACP methyl ester carboxylesterase
MEHVISKDGTLIAYERRGPAGGSPLVLVHGASADHTRWAPVIPFLEPSFTLYAVDRRGRGGSGDTEPYSVEREFEDLAAVIDCLGAPADVLGHSYGGLCSVGAALQTTHLRRLILYEPPIPTSPALQVGHPLPNVGGDRGRGRDLETAPTGSTGRRPPEALAKIRAFIAAGDREAAVVTFSREIVGISEAEIELLRASPAAWASRAAAIHTVLREMQTVEDYMVDLQPLKTLQTPVLLLLGSDSAPHLHRGVHTLAAALPNAEVVVMQGQQHLAINTAPELFADEVKRFLMA